MFRHLLLHKFASIFLVAKSSSSRGASFMPSRFYQTTPLLCFKKQDDGEARKGGSAAEAAAAGDSSGEGRGRDAAIFTPDAKLAPQKLTLMARPGWSRQELKKIVYKQNVNVGEYTREETEGTLGSESLLVIGTDQVDRHLPTLETMRQLYDGIPFSQLPIVYVRASPNNTIVSAFDYKATPIIYTSAGKEGFKNAKKKSPLSGQATGAAAAKRLLRRGVERVRVMVKGLGPGRMTAVKALASAGIDVVSITDKTPLPEMGPRPRKIRRR